MIPPSVFSNLLSRRKARKLCIRCFQRAFAQILFVFQVLAPAPSAASPPGGRTAMFAGNRQQGTARRFCSYHTSYAGQRIVMDVHFTGFLFAFSWIFSKDKESPLPSDCTDTAGREGGLFVWLRLYFQTMPVNFAGALPPSRPSFSRMTAFPRRLPAPKEPAA